MDAPTDLSAGAAQRITPRRTLLSAVDGMASMMSMMPREASRARGAGAAEVLERQGSIFISATAGAPVRCGTERTICAAGAIRWRDGR